MRHIHTQKGQPRERQGLYYVAGNRERERERDQNMVLILLR